MAKTAQSNDVCPSDLCSKFATNKISSNYI